MVQSMRSQNSPTEERNRRADEIARSFESHDTKDLTHYLREFAEGNPAAAAMWCFGIGFVLGWKLKPW